MEGTVIVNQDRESAMHIDSRRLAELLEVDGSRDRVWHDDELAAVYRHQLSAGIRCDLAGLNARLADQVKLLASSTDLILKSYADLFHHPNPPVELLVLVKDFAKRCRLSSESALPPDIAAVLYYQSIACALVRCRRRITKLSDDELREGLTWGLSRSWLDATTADLFRECMGRLAAEGEGS